jgi:hypothetical protein
MLKPAAVFVACIFGGGGTIGQSLFVNAATLKNASVKVKPTIDTIKNARFTQ